MAVKFNFQQVLLKTLIPTMNTLKDTAVLNIIKTEGKWAPEEKYSNSGGPVLFLPGQMEQVASESCIN